MKILVLSFYYRPDLCAGSFRTTALVEALKKKMPAGGHIEVLTTMPNRYNTYAAEARESESEDGVSIVRIPLPVHRSGMVDQAKAFVSYVRGVSQHIRSQNYNLVFATSSRLMTAVLGAWVARKMKAPLYLDIRDIFVDTIKDVLPARYAIPFKPVFSLFERYAIGTANKVNLVSRGFAGYFTQRYPKQRFSYFTNGIDDEFMLVPELVPATSANKVQEILYAGNLGEGQGLHAILPELAKRMRGRVHFKVIGDGGRREALRAALADAGVDNVELLPPVNRAQLIEAYKSADVLFLHLNDYDAFRKVLPSKMFEYGAMGKPIWAGVSGYAAEFVRDELENAAVFHPCDAMDAERVFGQLRMRNEVRDRFLARFARKSIAQEMASDIVGLTNERT